MDGFACFGEQGDDQLDSFAKHQQDQQKKDGQHGGNDCCRQEVVDVCLGQTLGQFCQAEALL